jgi:hypothetical protein
LVASLITVLHSFSQSPSENHQQLRRREHLASQAHILIVNAQFSLSLRTLHSSDANRSLIDKAMSHILKVPRRNLTIAIDSTLIKLGESSPTIEYAISTVNDRVFANRMIFFSFVFVNPRQLIFIAVPMDFISVMDIRFGSITGRHSTLLIDSSSFSPSASSSSSSSSVGSSQTTSSSLLLTSNDEDLPMATSTTRHRQSFSTSSSGHQPHQQQEIPIDPDAQLLDRLSLHVHLSRSSLQHSFAIDSIREPVSDGADGQRFSLTKETLDPVSL